MKSKQKRINSVLKQLHRIHQQLFGQPYTVGALSENSQFTKIIQAFKQLIFTIKASQEQRSNKQSQDKKYKNSHDYIRISHQIRQDISRADGAILQAVKRYKSDQVQEEYKKRRQKIIQNCYQLLKDVKQIEQGGTYMPPQYPTIMQLKKKLLGKQYRQSDRKSQINMQQQQAFQRFKREDNKIEDQLDQVIQGNIQLQNKMKAANQKIDQSGQKIHKITKKVDHLNERIDKANKDLAQVLKQYRRPNQLCLDITLVLLLLALIGVVINLIKGQTVG